MLNSLKRRVRAARPKTNSSSIGCKLCVGHLPGEDVSEELESGPELSIEEEGMGGRRAFHLGLPVHRYIPDIQ